MMLKDCMEFSADYFHMGLLTGCVSAFLYVMFLVCQDFAAGHFSGNKLLRKCWKIPFIALLGFYGHLVLCITVFSREKGTKYILNLVLFSTWGTDSWHLTLWLENILLLMPLGILLYILWTPFRKIGWSLFTGFGCSLMIECIQLSGQLGKFELDDIMNNVLGMLIAFWISKGTGRIFFILRRSALQAGKADQQLYRSPPK